MCMSTPSAPTPAPIVAAAAVKAPDAPEPTPSAPVLNETSLARANTEGGVTARKAGVNRLVIPLNIPSGSGNGLSIPTG